MANGRSGSAIQRLLKAAACLAARLESRLPGTRLTLAPWVDAYYEAV